MLKASELSYQLYRVFVFIRVYYAPWEVWYEKSLLSIIASLKLWHQKNIFSDVTRTVNLVGKANQSVNQSPHDQVIARNAIGNSRYRKATHSRNEKIVKRNIWLFAVSLTISWSPLVFFHVLRFFQIELQQNVCKYLYKMTSIVPYLRLDLN